MGLMQIMLQTWSGLRLRYGLGANPYDPHDNILAGAAYLWELHDRYSAPGFLAAYNAGPARYDDHLATGRPLPAETRAYVAVPLHSNSWPTRGPAGRTRSPGSRTPCACRPAWCGI
jgi:soluble lytic murein transglycosylase-like protein